MKLLLWCRSTPTRVDRPDLIQDRLKPRSSTYSSQNGVAVTRLGQLLCKRFKRVISSLILKTQSAFVPRCLITYNILVRQEKFHALCIRPGSNAEFMAIKTDMRKSYDIVEWSLIEAIMLKMSFTERWVNLLMCCVISVSYQIIVNREPRGRILPRRGLKQGNLLSPFLLISCVMDH